MNLLKNIFILTGLACLLACEVKPAEIHYGMDACDFCQMTIVDRQHASQLVTEKGRAYKYDAIECMMNALKKWDRPPVALYLVADYASPGELVDASRAHFLISPEIPSPMGGFLTAFADERARNKTVENAGGEKLNWAQLRGKFEITQ